MIRGFLSLGSNLGDREALLRAAMGLLGQGGVGILKASRVYETLPQEVADDQAAYLNMVVEVAYEGEPLALLSLCQGVEDALGRTRPYRHAPRTMDIDILLIEGISLTTDRLTLPHPGLEKRSFVVVPLAEIAPELILPGGRTALDVKKAMKDDERVSIRGI